MNKSFNQWVWAVGFFVTSACSSNPNDLNEDMEAGGSAGKTDVGGTAADNGTGQGGTGNEGGGTSNEGGGNTSDSGSACFEDSECNDGSVCGTGQCAPACEADDECADGANCCDSRCVNLAVDVLHCGACGTQCAANEFCAADACTEAVVANVCAAPIAVGMLDEKDNATTRAVLSALEQNCANPPMLTEEDQFSGELIDPQTGKPLAFGGQLLVATGGAAPQYLVRYLEDERVAPVYLEFVYPDGADETEDDPTEIAYRLSSTDAVIVSEAFEDTGPTRGLLLIETLRDPDTGGPILILYGVHAEGTVAATYYFENQILPNLSEFTNSWYIYEWIDDDTDGPSAGDSFMLVESGN